MAPEILAVLGSLLLLGLGLNAHFIKALVSSINKVEVNTATLLERSLDFDRRLRKNEEDIEMVRGRIHNLGNEFQKQLLAIEVKLAEIPKQ